MVNNEIELYKENTDVLPTQGNTSSSLPSLKEEDVEIFDGITLTSLYKSSYRNHFDHKEKIMELIDSLSTHLRSPTEAMMITPQIIELLGQNSKNDELLIKLIGLIQKQALDFTRGLPMGGDEEKDIDGNLVVKELSNDMKQRIRQELSQMGTINNDVINKIEKIEKQNNISLIPIDLDLTGEDNFIEEDVNNEENV